MDLDQWMVEPTISYRVSKNFEPLAGVRNNNLSGELRGPNIQRPGPGILPGPGALTGTQDLWDPMLGASLTLPPGKNFSLNLRADLGGFGAAFKG